MHLFYFCNILKFEDVSNYIFLLKRLWQNIIFFYLDESIT